MRRVMCVGLPVWPLQRLLHDQPGLRNKPVAICRTARVPEVAVCSRRAAQAGIRPGMPVAEARAIESNLILCEENLEADRRALEGLAHWADRYSPIVGLEDEIAPQSLLIG